MRILYVEDNPANVFLVKRVAKAGNHEVINYVDGEEAMRKMELINPDLILMDIQLAGEMDGLSVVRKLRSDGNRMPIVAVTAYAMVGDKERCLDAGCDDYLPKPLPVPRLLELFERFDPVNRKVEPEPAPTPEPDAEATVVDLNVPPVPVAATETPATVLAEPAPVTAETSPVMVPSAEADQPKPAEPIDMTERIPVSPSVKPTDTPVMETKTEN